MGPADPDKQRPGKWNSTVLRQFPKLRRSTLSRVPPRLKQARKFVRTMLKTFSSCITSTVKSPCSTILSKFGSKALFKKLRKLSLSLRKKTVTVLKLTERLGLTEAGVEVYDDVDRFGRRAATAG